MSVQSSFVRTTVGRPVESKYVHETEPPCWTVSCLPNKRGTKAGYETVDMGKGVWTWMSLHADTHTREMSQLAMTRDCESKQRNASN